MHVSRSTNTSLVSTPRSHRHNASELTPKATPRYQKVGRLAKPVAAAARHMKSGAATARTRSEVPVVSDLPLSSSSVLADFSFRLTKQEQTEILEYAEIFYFGSNARKPAYYTNECGEYKLVKGDHIAYRYEIEQPLGSGAFGSVCKCFDHKRKELVAIKIAKRHTNCAKQAASEIRLLQRLRTAHHIVRLKNYFKFRGHVCMVLELLETNLFDHLRNCQFSCMPVPRIKMFGRQILEALEDLAAQDVIHCDLKPENVLLTNKSMIKLADFGAACVGNEQVYTYIQSRYYRAPEVVLGVRYSPAIDMWSFGCLLFELFTGFPLFPGESEPDLLSRMMEVKGKPPSALLQAARKLDQFFEDGEPKAVMNKIGQVRGIGTRNLTDMFSCPDADFIDLIRRCLEWQSELRIRPSEALVHPFFQPP